MHMGRGVGRDERVKGRVRREMVLDVGMIVWNPAVRAEGHSRSSCHDTTADHPWQVFANFSAGHRRRRPQRVSWREKKTKRPTRSRPTHLRRSSIILLTTSHLTSFPPPSTTAPSTTPQNQTHQDLTNHPGQNDRVSSSSPDSQNTYLFLFPPEPSDPLLKKKPTLLPSPSPPSPSPPSPYSPPATRAPSLPNLACRLPAPRLLSSIDGSAITKHKMTISRPLPSRSSHDNNQ